MLDVKDNKKMVQQHFFKDLHNLASKEKKKEVVNVGTLVEEMKRVNGDFIFTSKMCFIC